MNARVKGGLVFLAAGVLAVWASEWASNLRAQGTAPAVSSDARTLRLPETPYQYADIDLPAHFKTAAAQRFDNTPPDNPVIDRQIVARHAFCTEVLFEQAPAIRASDAINLCDCGHRCILVIDDVARYAVFDYFRHRAAPISNDRGTARHGFRHDEPERLRPVDREEQPECFTEEAILFTFTDLTDEFDPRLIQQRTNTFVEIRPVDPVYLGRDAQWNPGAAGDANRAIGPLFG